jgi:hypothetical protein
MFTDDLFNLTYAVCAVFVAVFAWERFNTPPSNRSSTRRMLYWSSCAGYILTALALYTALSMLLQTASWRMFLIGGAGAQLPAPLIATLAMTTLLSSVPVLKTLDRSILSFFLDWGAIPGELKRRAATMTTRTFSVTADDVAKLRKSYRDGAHGEKLAEHLRSSGTDGLESLEYRYTQVVKLYDGVRHLSHQPRYAAFFAGAGERFDQMEKSTEAFLDQSAAWLTLAASVQELDNQPVYAALMRERREAFVQNCRDKFSELALFLAGAVLRSELTESGIVRRLRLLGFESAEPMNEPEFPIDSLTLLAVGVFLYLAGLSIFFVHLRGDPGHNGAQMLVTAKVATIRIATVGVLIWMLQRFSFFRRKPGSGRRYFGYVLCGLITAVVAAAISIPFAFPEGKPILTELSDSVPPIILSGILCLVLAFFCDDWPEDRAAPSRLRVLEASGCAAAMVVATTFVYLADLLPDSFGNLKGWMLVSWITLPSVLAFVIGLFVPHIYRSAHRAAAARRMAALRSAPESSPQGQLSEQLARVLAPAEAHDA